MYIHNASSVKVKSFKMGDNTKCISVDVEDNTSPIKYCFGCLSDSHEKQIQNYTFLCEPLKEILQVSLAINYLHTYAHKSKAFSAKVRNILDLYYNIYSCFIKVWYVRVDFDY